MNLQNQDKIIISLKRELDESYDIIFGKELFSQIALDLKEKPLGERYAIITDSNVKTLYADSLLAELKSQNLDAEIFFFEAGEPSKTIETCTEIIGQMSKQKFGRDSSIIALGGGVVGDLAGFIAAIFNRGVPYIQIPTTIISQADSSIGGKTAVDTSYGKNLIGAFKQPEKVYIDISTIKTLSEKDYFSGMAETIKHGIIADKELFEYLENNLSLLKKRDPEFLLHMAKNNCKIKGKIVESDPFEKGLRKILNYGHTIGHAVEKLSVDKFNRKETNEYLSHGEAISIGMMVAGRISNELGYFSEEELSRQEKLLLALNLPTKLPGVVNNGEIINITITDKKSTKGKARYVLPKKIGKMEEFNGEYTIEVENEKVISALNQTK